MNHPNVYDDAERAEAYSKLEFPGTYYLAYRDLPALIKKHGRGKNALDFGCGAGRSSRFLKSLGLNVIGIDIAEDMLKQARLKDPGGDYRLTDITRFHSGGDFAFDLILSVFTFDNIAGEQKPDLFDHIARMLKPEGIHVNLVSAPEIYLHEWASFTTKDFPENRQARSGDTVRIIMTDVEDRRPVEDILCTDETYRALYRGAGLEVVETHKPLGTKQEPYGWINETRVSPWTVYVSRRVR